MKKSLFIFPLIGLLLSGCELPFITITNNSTNDSQSQKEEDHEEEHREEEEHNDDPIKVTSISLNKQSLTLEVGQSASLTYTILPENATDKTVTWSTTNSTVATVLNGSVNAQKAGTCSISITTNDGKKTSTCNITVTKKEEEQEEGTNLGTKTIAEVKEYIAKNPVSKNSYGNGVNKNVYVTIKGVALAKIDLIKGTSKFGLDISEHGKVILGDETGAIAVASVVNNLGTSLWGKIGDNVCKDTSKYIVTGYISEYLGHPELLVKSFTWDSTLDIEIDYSILSSEIMSLEQFYTAAKNVQYNCAGHGYGEVVTIKNLRCYYMEADGQGKRYYNFTDGTKNIRVNAFNVSGATEGNIYNVTGVISLKSLSPIIVAFNIESSSEGCADFDYKTAATSITIQGLKAIHGSQEDTDTKYPQVIECYGNFYKTTGYMVAVEENGKLYVGISDSPRDTAISGKTNAMANYNVVLIKNNNFWNTTEDQLYLFNPIYDEYLLEDKQIEIYFVTRQLEYSSKKPMWEILLIPQFIEDLKTSE